MSVNKNKEYYKIKEIAKTFVLSKDSGILSINQTDTQNILAGEFEIFSPKYKKYTNALVFPINKDLVERTNTKFIDYLYDSSNKAIENARFERTLHPIGLSYALHPDLDNLSRNDIEYIRGDVVYGGILLKAFGHALTDSLSHLWIVEKLQKDITKYKFIFHGADFSRLYTKWGFDVFVKELGIKPEQILMIRKPVIFENLIVPEQGIVLFNRISYEMASVWERITKNINTNKKKERKIYMSRRDVVAQFRSRKLVNEEEVEKYFTSLGYEIVYSSMFKNEYEKINLFSEAKIIVGISGSGLHNAVFSHEGTTVIQFFPNFASNGLPLQSMISLILKHKLCNIISLDGNRDTQEWKLDLSQLKELEYIFKKGL